jgi:hypothetical protein
MKWRLFSFLMRKTGDPGRKKLQIRREVRDPQNRPEAGEIAE